MKKRHRKTLEAVFARPVSGNLQWRNPKELRSEFKKSLHVFFEVCKEKGIEPRRHYSGKFNLRISPELHEQLAIGAQVKGKSVNKLAEEALQQVVSDAG